MPYKDKELSKQKAAERWTSWAERNKDKANSRGREWRDRNPEYMLVASALRRSKRDNLEFTLTRGNCPEIPSHCPITNLELKSRNDGKKGPCDSSPTLDRIDSSKGYIEGNIRVISHKANRWKDDMTI